MSLATIVPVILCGGRGKRLWPLSTPEMPKVFHRLVGPNSLFQNTVLRCKDGPFAACAIVVGSAAHHVMIAKQLEEIGARAQCILEPVARDSLPAVLAGALVAHRTDPNAMIFVSAADHHIPDHLAFADAASAARGAADAGHIVTFGITPESPSENYGYLHPGQRMEGTAVCVLTQFTEKPNRAKAVRLIAEGWLWNSGNFLCRADAVLEAAQKFAPIILNGVAVALDCAQREGDEIFLSAEPYNLLTPESFDRSIMERAEHSAILPVSYAWRDLGTWDAIIALQDA